MSKINTVRYFFPRIFLQNSLCQNMVMLKVYVNSESRYIYSWKKNSPGVTEHTVFVADMERETFEKGFKGNL